MAKAITTTTTTGVVTNLRVENKGGPGPLNIATVTLDSGECMSISSFSSLYVSQGDKVRCVISDGPAGKMLASIQTIS